MIFLLPLPTVSKKYITMPKMKTHSGTKKRFKLTGSGKVKRFQAGAAHLLRKKSKKAKLRLSGATTVSTHDTPRIKRQLVK